MEQELRNEAKHRYVDEQKNLPDICTELGIEEATLWNWKQADCWDAERMVMLTSKQYHMKNLYQLLDKVNRRMGCEDEINPKDADLAVKYTAAIKNLDAEVGLPEIIDVAKMFVNWLQQKSKDQARKIALELDGFIRHKLKETVA